MPKTPRLDRRTIILLVAFLVAFAVFVYAAIPGDDDPAPSATAGPTSTETAPATGGPEGGGQALPKASASEASEPAWASDLASGVSRATVGGAPTPAVPDGVGDAVAGFIRTGVNANATFQTTPDGWIEQMKAYSTMDMSGSRRGSSTKDDAWVWAHSPGVDIQGRADAGPCVSQPGGTNDSTHADVICTVSVTLVDSKGNEVGTKSPAWSLQATTTTMEYILVNDGAWKVQEQRVASAN